jgi:protoporphyrinogen oxidase
MNAKDFESVLEDTILPKILKMRSSGQKEYAQDEEDIFANFKREGKLLNISKEKILLTFFLKHVDGIVSYHNGHISQRESIEGRYADAIVYLMLLWAMNEE